MKGHSIIFNTVFLMLFIFNAPASVLYVDLNCTNATLPYADWNIAATNIQDAIDASTSGDLVLVTNGIYATGGRVGYSPYGVLTNRVALTKRVTVQSVNGPAVTIIMGFQIPGITNGTSAIRCAFLTNGATLNGFTLANGATGTNAQLSPGEIDLAGGGVFCWSSSAVVSNCIIVGNCAAEYGGGAFGGTLNNCLIISNSVHSFISNTYGGGAYSGDGTMTLNNCVLTDNSAANGGGAYGTYPCYLNNCVIATNSAKIAGGGAGYCSLSNCTVSGNSGGNTGGGVYYSTAKNCIVFYNTALNNSNYYLGGSQPINNFYGCCTTPLPVGGSIGNITNEPLFINISAGDYRLQSNSPCINAGKNSYVTSSTDLDGNPRIAGGTVDIGAYEFQSPSSIISYAYLQQYSLPTDGSADFLDSDGDGMNNWQEWKAGTIPTNAASVLKLASPSNSLSGLTVTWQSVTNVTYYLQSSTNLPVFVSIQSNLVGQTGTTSYTDITATNGVPYFYRVGVQ